jgi:predicted phosphate transport protein (TIGR00153 family)
MRVFPRRTASIHPRYRPARDHQLTAGVCRQRVRVTELETSVRFRLTPQRTVFYDLYASSGANLTIGARLLKELLGAEQGQRRAIAEKMREAEHSSDELTHAIMRELNESFITPFDREDIYRLASSLDDVMDAMEAAVDLVVLYNLGDLPAEIADQVDVLERAAELTAEAMQRMRSIRELQPFWIELNRLENQADQIYRKLLARLFSGDYDALTVLKLKEVVDQLEAAADAFETVANTVETIAVKES